jgi:RNA polymerase sigma-70 factor (ECF subfamily)
MSATVGSASVDDVTSLVEQARGGSAEAFAGLVRQHHRPVRAYLGRLVRDAAVVDDLAQEVFLTAYRSLADYQGRASLEAWLLGIARHRALHYLRGESRRQRRENRLLEDTLERQRVRQAEAEDSERLVREVAVLRDCLQELPPHSLQLVKDHYFEDQTAEAIAVRLGKKGNAVRMLLLRVRRALAVCIRRKLDT